MKRYALNRRSASILVLYPNHIPFDVVDLEVKMASIGVGVSSVRKNNMVGVKLHFAARSGNVGLEAMGSHLCFFLTQQVDSEMVEDAWQLPFTMFHTVEVHKQPDVEVEPKVTLLPGKNARLKVALAHEDNMKIYLFGAHAKLVDEAVLIRPRNATFYLKVTAGEKRIRVDAVSATNDEIMDTFRFRGPAELNRHISSVLRVAQQAQKVA